MLDRFQISWLLVNHARGRTRRIRWFWMPALIIGLCLLTIPVYWAVKTYHLTQERERILTEIDQEALYKQQMESKLQTLIAGEKAARIIAGLPEIHPDIRRVGVGGATAPDAPSQDSDQPSDRTIQLYEDISRLQREAELSLSSLRDIEQRVRDIKVYWQGVPSVTPVTGVLTSRFGMREDPFTQQYRMHKGIDIAAPPGAPVKAPAAGIISHAGLNARYGRFIEIDHQNGMTTRFGHLSAILVRTGMKIGRGDIIGRVGMTGRANGYHLHYEVRMNGRRVNPEQYLEPESAAVQ